MASNKALVQYNDFFEMLSDEVRMGAYAQAIEACVKPGDVVLDLGAGTGILGFMALRAGAAKLYCIEKSNAIELARAVAGRNGFEDRVVFFEANSKDVELPERVDLIVSETLGCFGLDESTLDFTADARRRFLKPGGTLLPRKINLKVSPVEAPEAYAKLDFWHDVQGIDFTPAYELFSTKLMNETVAPDALLAEPQTLAEVDFHTNDSPTLEARALLHIQRPARVHGVAGWFDLDLAEGIQLSTSPSSPATHWRQAFFPIRETLHVVEGDILEFTLRLAPAAASSDNTTISYQYRCTQIGAK